MRAAAVQASSIAAPPHKNAVASPVTRSPVPPMHSMCRVGLDLYLEMLEEAVGRLKGTPEAQTVETELTLGLPAHIPASYIEDGRERLRCYKTLTSATGGAAREEAALGIRDRFGPFPEELRNFLAVLDFKQFLTELQVQKADVHINHGLRGQAQHMWRIQSGQP